MTKKIRKLLDNYVVVNWIDSVGLPALWHDDEEVLDLELIEIISIGRVMNEDKDYITLACHLAPNQIAGAICIPRVAINKIKVLSHYKKIFERK